MRRSTGSTNEALRDYLGARIAAWLAGRSS